MRCKEISELSFLTKEQKEYFDNYVLYEDGTVFNTKTSKETKKTWFGIRGYVVNLTRFVDGRRKQKMITISRALVDLFVKPVKDSDIIDFNDKNKENIEISNLKIREPKNESKDD